MDYKNLKKLFGKEVEISAIKTRDKDQSVNNFRGIVTEIGTNGHIFVHSDYFGYGYHLNLNEPHEIKIIDSGLEIDFSKKLVYNFFKNRFGSPEAKPGYYKTWLRRFEERTVEQCIAEMDSSSFDIFVKVCREMRNK